jgi:hypothetical protein
MILKNDGYKWIFLLIFNLMALAFAPAHKFYFSFTNIKIDTSKKAVNITCKLFIDDLENDLTQEFGSKTNITASTNNPVIQQKILKYINTNFQVYLSFKPVELQLIGFEVENDVVWVYLEGKTFGKKCKSVKVKNTLLCKLTSEQTNVVQLNWDGSNYTEKMNCANPEWFVPQ